MTKMSAANVRLFSLLEALVDYVKDDITFEDVSRMLPFASSLWEGTTKTHIVSNHAFPIRLPKQGRVIEEGDTLCGRQHGPLFLPLNGLPVCPGCHSIGQALVARETMKNFPQDYFDTKYKK